MAASWQLLRLSLSRHTEPCILLGECTRDNLTVFTKPRRFGLRRWKPTKARLSAEVHCTMRFAADALISAKRIPTKAPRQARVLMLLRFIARNLLCDIPASLRTPKYATMFLEGRT